MIVEGSKTFIYVEEGMEEEESYRAPLSSTGIELDEVTHVDETKLPREPASMSERASRAASISVNRDPASKRMVDDLVNSETTDDGEDAEFTKQFNNGISHAFADPEHISSPARYIGDETSYGLIGSATAREHFGDLQSPVTNLARLPSITNYPFELQPGEETPGSRYSTTKRKTLSHSQQNSQTRFPLQRQPNAYPLDSSPSSPSTMPDPVRTFRSLSLSSLFNTEREEQEDIFLLMFLSCNATSLERGILTPKSAQTPAQLANGSYRTQHPLNSTFPSVQNYTKGPKNFTRFGDSTLYADEPNFLSLEVFEGSTWGGGSDQTARKAANIMTPPNGQGAG